jgi:large subunit ribosomal protein L6
MSVEDDQIVIRCEYPRVKEKAMVGTYVAHIKNMFHGVTVGFDYHMKVVFNHFPMKVTVKGKQMQIDNYQGGKAPRFADIVGDCVVKVNGADVTISGPDIEACGQTAANIEKATSRRGFDTRVFQDGIYIVEKSHKVRE